MDAKILGSRIKSRRIELKMTQGEIAEPIGVAISTIQRYEAGTIGKIKLPVVEAIARVLNVNADWLTGKTENMDSTSDNLPPGALPYEPTHRIPVLGRVSAGMPLYAEENIEGYIYTDLNGGAEYFALRVSGDSMNSARISDGDLIVARRQDTVEQGEIAVVIVGDDEATIKRFYQTDTVVTLMPQSTNPAHKPQIYNLDETHITVIGKVVKVEFMI